MVMIIEHVTEDPSTGAIGSVDLPALPNYTVDVRGSFGAGGLDDFGVFRLSGGDTVAVVQPFGPLGPDDVTVQLSPSDLVLTVVPVELQDSRINTNFDYRRFADLAPKLSVDVPQEFPGLDYLKIAINSYTMDQFGDLTFLRTTTHEYCAITKVSVINPYLILQNNGVAPYAYDITVTPVQQQ